MITTQETAQARATVHFYGRTAGEVTPWHKQPQTNSERPEQRSWIHNTGNRRQPILQERHTLPGAEVLQKQTWSRAPAL